MKGIKAKNSVLFSLIDGKYTYEVMYGTTRSVVLYIDDVLSLSMNKTTMNCMTNRAVPFSVLERMQSFVNKV
ncbi:hypothetical protein DIDNDMLP_00207 [Klebsiella phage KP13-7]|nr:hypothetical protein DIDNDMLP_00207 [Klebsiella phage KP13-7]